MTNKDGISVEGVRALKQLLEMATGPHTTLDEATAIYEVEKHFKAQERAYLALSERVGVLEEALEQICAWCPVTCEMTLAHNMAETARAALSHKGMDQ